LKAQEIQGRVVGISDRDTFKLLENDSILHRVRLANIDCPEKGQPFSNKAKQFTSDAIFSKEIEIKVLKKDRYGRLIAKVLTGRWEALPGLSLITGIVSSIITFLSVKYVIIYLL